MPFHTVDTVLCLTLGPSTRLYTPQFASSKVKSSQSPIESDKPKKARITLSPPLYVDSLPHITQPVTLSAEWHGKQASMYARVTQNRHETPHPSLSHPAPLSLTAQPTGRVSHRRLLLHGTPLIHTYIHIPYIHRYPYPYPYPYHPPPSHHDPSYLIISLISLQPS